MRAAAKAPGRCRHPRNRLVRDRPRGDCTECLTHWCRSCGALGEWNAEGTEVEWTLPATAKRAAGRKESK